MKRFRLLSEPGTRFVKGRSEDEDKAWEADRFDWIEAIKSILSTPMNPMGGATIDEMRQSIRVLDAVEEKHIGDILELEDADHAHLVQKIDAFRWSRVDRRFVRFVTTIKDATDTVLDESPEEVTSRVNGTANTTLAPA